ncbi:MAG: putative metal-dependent phosphoesterases (PHP family) [Firmicutes bacterium]|nr:putative metal-dependent phosphoesterases (PHP family) [Bacillota bacterium]MDI6706092.1 PHP domain-containing protein [Bacillota bacterium]
MDQKNLRTDLHIHTTASDGTWGPEEVIEELKSNDIGLFSITDHDTTESIEKAAALAEENGISFIPGVEVSVSYNKANYHILGLGINPQNHGLQAILERNRVLMEQKDDESILYLEARHGCVSFCEYREYINNPERGGWKALNYLIDKGLCSSYRDFFSLFIGYGNPFEKLDFAMPHEAVEAIRSAGGIPVLAHPGASFYSKDYKAVIKYMLTQGIGGIECFHPENDHEITQYCLGVCKEQGLLITGGSDCHGDFVQGRRLGHPEIYLSSLRLDGIHF